MKKGFGKPGAFFSFFNWFWKDGTEQFDNTSGCSSYFMQQCTADKF